MRIPRPFRMSLLTALLAIVLGVFCLVPAPARAGTLVNTDDQVYQLKVFWEDLSPIEAHDIGPGDSLVLRDATCIIELVGKYDNIYMRPKQTIWIHNGIMVENKPKPSG